MQKNIDLADPTHIEAMKQLGLFPTDLIFKSRESFAVYNEIWLNDHQIDFRYNTHLA